MTERDLAFPNLHNVRDLGGCRTRDGQITRRRSLLRADDLCRLTPAGEQALLDYGVRTVIDLRWPADAETYPNFLHRQSGQIQHQSISLLGTSIQVWIATRPQRPKEMFNCLVLQCRATSRDVCLSAEHTAYQWVTASEWLRMDAPASLKQVVERLSGLANDGILA